MLAQRVAVICSIAIAIVSVYAMRTADADLWGHLRYGRLLVENGGQLPEDPFAYTTTCRVWNDHETLAQMLWWQCYSVAGPVGLIAIKCVLGGGAVACLYFCLRLSLSDVRVWGPLWMLLSVALGRWFLFRPQLFTFLFLGLTVLLVMRHLLGRRGFLWTLPLVMILWVNVHGGFLAGLGVLGLGLLLRTVQGVNRHGLAIGSLARALGPLAGTLLLCLASTLLNAHGWGLWPYMVTELGFRANREYIQEWMPLLEADGPWSGSAIMVYLPLGLLVVFGIAAQVRGRRIADVAVWQWLLSCVPLVVMAFTSNRHSPVLILWLTPVLGLLVAAALEGREGGPIWAWGITLLWAVAIVPAMLMTNLVTADPLPHIALPPRSRAPAGLVHYLRENDLEGNLYAPLWWGSSLTWENYPRIRVALDGRNVTLFAPEDVAANFDFYYREDADLDTPSHATDFLALEPETPVLGRVRQDRRWVKLFEDGEVVLFVRADQAAVVERLRTGELKQGTAKAPVFME